MIAQFSTYVGRDLPTLIFHNVSRVVFDEVSKGEFVWLVMMYVDGNFSFRKLNLDDYGLDYVADSLED